MHIFEILSVSAFQICDFSVPSFDQTLFKKIEDLAKIFASGFEFLKKEIVDNF